MSSLTGRDPTAPSEAASTGTDPLDRLAAHVEADEVAVGRCLPAPAEVAAFADRVVDLLFPTGVGPHRSAAEIRAEIADLAAVLARVLDPMRARLPDDPAALGRRFIAGLPAIHDAISLDAAAIEAGDPAAHGVEEVVLAYPGFTALAFHRIAHALDGLGIELVPRMIAEIAHGRTGVDIHPRATIGRSCCIDHGTGIVVGETAVIGDGVKLYQGVTLGALSVSKAAAGTKRHPTIGDRVVIYANATVLGGETIVGHDSVVGGNVWLTSSVPPYSLVYHQSQVRVRSTAEAVGDSDWVI